ALITGIFERLINALKSFGITAIKLLFSGRIKELFRHIDFYFLAAVLSGVVIAIFSLARLFEFLFRSYPVYIWSYFFGLILASVFFVGGTVRRWSVAVIISFTLGTFVALIISFLNPAIENQNFFYLILCGVAGVCSMILPGISGSFILILMGNYYLIVIDAVNNLRFEILTPVAIGIVVGLIGFSHLLSWVYGRYRNQTIALLTGFILGSLLIIWPWKEKIYVLDTMGNVLMKAGEPVVARYQATLPEGMNIGFFIALLIMVIGVATITLIEKLSLKETK
ncbi:MAG: DUF368 domain-containing protein, partial [Bacteroidales bacterium]|nr:DUF368 domain-containing protein [Bacteroidales bacterium]